MMNKIIYTGVLSLLLLFWMSCNDYVQDIDPLIDAVEEERVNDARQIPFMIKGVKEQYARCEDQVLVLADGLSDQLIFDQRVPNATFTSFKDIDIGVIRTDNNSVDGAYNPLGEARFFADDLVRRVNEIGLGDGDLKNEALFNANFYGGLTRYLYATYFGLTETQGGGIIDNGPFIPSDQMYDLALAKLNEALNYVDFDYSSDPVLLDSDHATKVVNSFKARIYLFKGEDANAATAAAAGLQQGDAPFLTLRFLGDGTTGGPDNFYWQQAGAPRSQYVTDFRFNGYVTTDPDEANRIQLGARDATDGSVTFYYQMKYALEDDPIPSMTWQENNLMLAELVLKGATGGDALQLVNDVRTSHGISALGSIDMNGLIVERDKELFCTGIRLPDQRRFDAQYGTWHLDPGLWQYLPITDNERNENPNID
jgi:hypothetical protein